MTTTVRGWTAATLLAMAGLIACESESSGGTTPAADVTTTDTTLGTDTALGSDSAVESDTTTAGDTTASTDATASTDVASGTDAVEGSDTSAGTDATAGSDSTGGCGVATWDDVDELFASNCGGCHTGGFKYEASDCASVSAKASLIITKIESGAMPKNATLGAVAKGKMLLWLNSGASCAVCN